MKRALVILPTYNEAQNIGLMLDKLIKLSRDNKSYCIDVLVVDDQSPDGTAKIIKKYQENNKNILLISGRKNGLGNAYIRGMKYGLKNSIYFAFVMMDADFSHDPAVIPTLLDKLTEQNDVVIGSRYTKGGFIPGNWPLIRIINSKIANFLARLFGEFDKNIKDLTGGFRAIKVDSLKRIKLEDINASGYFFEVKLLYMLTEHGFNVSEVPICFADRERGSSKISSRDVLEFLHKVYALNPNSRIRRICSFALVGGVGTLVNIITLSVLLRLLHFNPILSDAIAIELSILSNFYLNNKYTFQNADKAVGMKLHIATAGKFNAGAVVGALISLTLFTVLFKTVHLNYLVADLLAISISVSWNYWVSTRYVWRVANAIP